MVGMNFAPSNWALCDGRLLQIAQFDALYSLLGTTYGGDGQVTFGIPDFRGRSPINMGQAPGLSNYVLGQMAGTETVTLNVTQIPAHSHIASGNSNSAGAVLSPAGKVWSPNADTTKAAEFGAYNSASVATLGNGIVANAGGSLPHENMPPYLAINFIIALYGVYPTRN